MKNVGRRGKHATGFNLCALLMMVVLIGCTGCTTTREEPKVISPATSDNPVQSSESSRASIRLQLGIDYLQQDQLATVLKELNNAISIDPNLADAYGVRALVYVQMRNDNLAEQDFLKALRISPNNPDYTNNYAWFLCMHGEEKKAIGMFDQVINDRTYTQPVKALNNAGLCSLKIKDDSLATSYFLRSFRLDPNNATTNLNLARLNYKKEDFTNAQFYIDRIVKSDMVTAEIMWLGVKISHKLNDQVSKSSLAVQLRRRFPESEENAALQRGDFNE